MAGVEKDTVIYVTVGPNSGDLIAAMTRIGSLRKRFLLLLIFRASNFRGTETESARNQAA